MKRMSLDNIAEVDFVIAFERQIFPLEVKAGYSKKKKSLAFYADKFLREEHSPVLSRTTLMNFAYDGNIINYPLYATTLFPKLTKTNSRR